VSYPVDLGTTDGRIVVDNSAPALDGDRYTLTEAVKPPPEPTLEAIYPDTFTIGSPDTPLSAFGGPWERGDRLVVADNVERTTYVSPYQLTTWINSAVWQGPDVIDVYVHTQNGVDTDPQQLTIAA
jgi:hypothetical protein